MDVTGDSLKNQYFAYCRAHEKISTMQLKNYFCLKDATERLFLPRQTTQESQFDRPRRNISIVLLEAFFSGSTVIQLSRAFYNDSRGTYRKVGRGKYCSASRFSRQKDEGFNSSLHNHLLKYVIKDLNFYPTILSIFATDAHFAPFIFVFGLVFGASFLLLQILLFSLLSGLTSCHNV